MSETATSVEIAHLRAELEELKADVRADRIDVRKEREADRKDIRGVHDFQIWLTGALAAAALFFGLFATEIKKALGL